MISFVGLPGLEAQRQFLSQLAMTLFSWIKKHPKPPGRPLRGLLVIDEAKDFVPSQSATACKPNLVRLAAQARKYHLGLVFATHRSERRSKTRSSATVLLITMGKAGSPEAIKVIREQIQLRRGTGDDVPTLPKGTFYVYNADAQLSSPVKVCIPCAFHAPSEPPGRVRNPPSGGGVPRSTADRDRVKTDLHVSHGPVVGIRRQDNPSIQDKT